MSEGMQTTAPASSPDPKAEKIREVIFETLKVDLENWGKAGGIGIYSRAKTHLRHLNICLTQARTIAVLRDAEVAGLGKIVVDPNPR